MPEFRQISFDANELEAIRLACEMQAEAENVSLDESASGELDGVVMQEVKADDMLLIKQTVRIFKPGQKILITPDDLELMKQNLENFLDMADYALTSAARERMAETAPGEHRSIGSGGRRGSAIDRRHGRLCSAGVRVATRPGPQAA